MLIPFNHLFAKYNLTFNGVIHVGANVGEEADMYRSLGIQNQIWIEANPDIFVKLKNNISNNPNAVAFNICAGDREGIEILHVSNNHSQSSSVLQLGTHKQEHPDVFYVKDIEVPMFRLDTFLSNCGLEHRLDLFDFLNVDVQGFELNVLRGLGELVKRFKAIYLEVNKSEVYLGCAQIGDIEKYLNNLGFAMVEVKWAPNKTWGDALFIRI